MFPKASGREIYGDVGYIDFHSTGEAERAKDEWGQYKKIVHAHPTDSTKHVTKEAFEVELIPSGGSEKRKTEHAEKEAREKAEREATGCKVVEGGEEDTTKQNFSVIWEHTVISEQLEWCTVTELSAEDPFVVPFEFKAASLCGSVSRDLKYCTATTTGNMVFVGSLGFLFSSHLEGWTWEGNLTVNDFVFSRKLKLCAIIKPPTKLSDPKHIQLDVTGTITCLLPLFKIKETLPPYYDNMLERSRRAPMSLDPTELENFQNKMVSECCFIPFEARMALVMEFHPLYKNLEKSKQDAYDKSAPRNLEDWQFIHMIDKLLYAVHITGVLLSKGAVLEPKFADEGSYIWHVVEHAPSKLSKILNELFTLEERHMLIWHYYKKYLPELLKLMFKERWNQPWLDVLCKSYERARPLSVTIPRSLIPLSVTVTVIKEGVVDSNFKERNASRQQQGGQWPLKITPRRRKQLKKKSWAPRRWKRASRRSKLVIKRSRRQRDSIFTP